jgi:hypothetical protein
MTAVLGVAAPSKRIKKAGLTPALEDKGAPRIFLGTHRSLLAKPPHTAAPAARSLSIAGSRYLLLLRPIRLSIVLDSNRNLEALHQAPSATVDPCPSARTCCNPRKTLCLTFPTAHDDPRASGRRRLPDAGEFSYQKCDALTEVLSQGGTSILPRIAHIARCTGDAFAVSSWCKSGAEAAVARPSPIARRASSSRTGLRSDPLGVEDGVVEHHVVGATGLHLANLEAPDRRRA